MIFHRNTSESPKMTTNFNFINEITFNEQGLIPAISIQYDSREVLMMAWMNKESLIRTLQTKKVCYWSRSRQSFWKKGEISGNEQKLINIYLDCDKDTLLLEIDQKGAACHTGRRSCFYYKLEENDLKEASSPIVDPKDLYK